MPSMSEQPERLYTRRDAIDYIRETYGIPVARSRILKDAMARRKRFPRPKVTYGNVFLYTQAQLDAYATTLIRPVSDGQAAP